MEKTGWKALESNPDTINPFLAKIGVTGIECVDVYSFDDEMLQFVPKPQLAMMLCFPSNQAREYLDEKYEEALKTPRDKKIFFMKQNKEIGNACGTFALLHSIANLEDRVDIGKGSFKKWLESVRDATEEERCDLLAGDSDLAGAHDETAEDGETEQTDDVEYHFIAYVNIKGELYEIDSCAPFPIKYGSTTDETLVKDAGIVINQMLDRVPGLNISALALVGKI